MNLTWLLKKVTMSTSCVGFCPNSYPKPNTWGFARSPACFPLLSSLHTLTLTQTQSHTLIQSHTHSHTHRVKN